MVSDIHHIMVEMDQTNPNLLLVFLIFQVVYSDTADGDGHCHETKIMKGVVLDECIE